MVKQDNIKLNQASIFHKTPYGAMFKIFTVTKDTELYINISKDETRPSWIRFGEFLEELLEPYLQEDTLIQSCLKLYDTKQKNHFTILNKTINNLK